MRGTYFDLHFRREGTAGASSEARLGLVIAKKFARRAVLRNLLKRIGREAFRHARPGLPSRDLVLRLARPLPRGDREERQAWRADIDGLLARLDGECLR